MRIIGCDLHARQQTIAMLDTDTSELVEKTPEHEGDGVRKFYSALPSPVLVGIEATGSMYWFLDLLEELGIECRVGYPKKIRKAETRKQKHERATESNPAQAKALWRRWWGVGRRSKNKGETFLTRSASLEMF